MPIRNNNVFVIHYRHVLKVKRLIKTANKTCLPVEFKFYLVNTKTHNYML